MSLLNAVSLLVTIDITWDLAMRFKQFMPSPDFVSECSNDDIRPLLGGNSPQEGLVEVCHNGRFHRIPANAISIHEATVICRQLEVGSGKKMGVVIWYLNWKLC